MPKGSIMENANNTRTKKVIQKYKIISTVNQKQQYYYLIQFSSYLLRWKIISFVTNYTTKR